MITGASGFLGRALLSELPRGRFARIRVLVHREPGAGNVPGEFTAVRGDLLDRQALRDLVAPGATVIHLAYLATGRALQDNLAALDNLLAACRQARVRRLVHCGTAVVAGSATGDVITEETPCNPATDYERTKHRLEQALLEAAAGHFACAILRPTVVFGPGGRNLQSQARRILRGSRIANFLYSSLQGDRRMNLVSVHNVVAALCFLAGAGPEVDQQTYIVSDDAHPANNYRDVARILGRELGRERVVSGYALPPAFLKAAHWARGRTNLNPRRVYADDKLRAAGFVKPRDFEAALVEFAHSVGRVAGDAR